jgi:hypothetical protein
MQADSLQIKVNKAKNRIEVQVDELSILFYFPNTFFISPCGLVSPLQLLA